MAAAVTEAEARAALAGFDRPGGLCLTAAVGEGKPGVWFVPGPATRAFLDLQGRP